MRGVSSQEKKWKTQKELWDILKARIATSSASSGPLYIRQQFNTEKYESGPLITYISKLLHYQDQLAFTLQKLEDQQVINQLLQSLSPTFDTIIEVLNTQTTLTLDHIIASL